MKETLENEEAFVVLAGAIEPVPASPSGRARLMAAIDAERFLPFRDELARHFDLSSEAARALLCRIDDPSAWTAGLSPVEGIFDFRPGQRLEPLHAGFVRMGAGMRIPFHEHTDRELTFVLEGELADEAGGRHGPGAIIDMPEGSRHEVFVPEGGRALVALLHGKIRLLGA